MQLSFLTRTRETIAVSVLEARWGEENERFFQLGIAVTPEIFKIIDRLRLFNLHPQVKKLHGSENVIDGEREVELDIRLSGELLAIFPGEINDREKALEFLKNSQVSGSLLTTENWFARHVKQLQLLPENMQELGTLKLGYSTTWADAMDFSESSLKERLLHFLQENRWEYTRIDPEIFSIDFHGKNGAWVCLLEINETKNTCACYSVLPATVQEERRREIAILLNRINHTLEVGNFELNEENGTLRFRTSICLGQQRLSKSLFHELFQINVLAMDRFVGQLLRLCSENEDRKNPHA